MKKNIVKYWVVEADNSNQLSGLVNSLIKDKWEPYGPMVSYQGMLHQSMVLYDTEITDEDNKKTIFND